MDGSFSHWSTLYQDTVIDITYKLDENKKPVIYEVFMACEPGKALPDLSILMAHIPELLQKAK